MNWKQQIENIVFLRSPKSWYLGKQGTAQLTFTDRKEADNVVKELRSAGYIATRDGSITGDVINEFYVHISKPESGIIKDDAPKLPWKQDMLDKHVKDYATPKIIPPPPGHYKITFNSITMQYLIEYNIIGLKPSDPDLAFDKDVDSVTVNEELLQSWIDLLREIYGLRDVIKKLKPKKSKYPTNPIPMSQVLEDEFWDRVMASN